MQRAKKGRAGTSARREELVYRALADATRRRILAMLVAQEMAAGAVAEAFPEISRPAVSKHLALLVESGLVTARAAGRERRYALDPTPLGEVVGYIATLDAFWAQRLGGLAAVLDRETR